MPPATEAKYMPRCCWCQQPFRYGTVLGLKCFTCISAGCWKRIQPFILTAGKKAVYVPLPKQVELSEAVNSRKYRWILYGGAAGGSKSHGIRWLLYRLCATTPQFRCLLLRRTYPELEKTHMREATLEAPLLGAKPLLSGKPPIVEFPQTGSILEFGHCQDEKNVSSYLSAEYAMIAFDELVTFEERMVLLLASRCRVRKGSGLTPMIVAGTNPGGVGGLWVKDRWIDKTVDRRRYTNYDPDTHLYIPSLLDDNPYIDESYEEFLQGLDDERRAAYRYGRWDVFEGQYFKEFDQAVHVRSIEVPKDLPRFGGMDWGYTAPGVHLWGVALPGGHLHIEREFVFQESVALDVAQHIKQLTNDFGLRLTITHCDPAMWVPSGQLGESIAETIQLQGIPLAKANNDRLNGWQRVRHWLRQAPDGQPWLTISPECPYLIRTLPMLVHDLHRVEDIDTHGDDHAADALRYLLMSRPAPFITPPEPELGNDTAGWLLHQALREADRDTVLGGRNIRA